MARWPATSQRRPHLLKRAPFGSSQLGRNEVGHQDGFFARIHRDPDHPFQLVDAHDVRAVVLSAHADLDRVAFEIDQLVKPLLKHRARVRWVERGQSYSRRKGTVLVRDWYLAKVFPWDTLRSNHADSWLSHESA